MSPIRSYVHVRGRTNLIRFGSMFAAIVIDAACGLGIVATTVFVVHMSVRANAALKALQNCQHNPSPSNKNNLNYFAELANYALIPVFGLDYDGRIVIWNIKMVELSDFSSEDVIGHDLTEFIIDEPRDVVDILTRRVNTKSILKFKRSGGGQFQVESKGMLENGLILYLAKDTTDRVNNDEMLEEAQKAAFVAKTTAKLGSNAIQDIRTVLVSILLLTAKVKETVNVAFTEGSREAYSQLPKQIADYGAQKVSICAHVTSILNDMLDVFKMEQQLDDAQSRIPVDLGALCIHAQNIVKSRLRREHVEVQLKSPPPGDVFVMSDPSLLLQFLTHLAAAAETFAYPTDCITIVCDVCESSTPHQRRIFLGVAESERSHTSQTKSRKKAFKRQGLSEEKIDELDVLPKGTESSSTEKVSHLEDKIEDLYSDDPTLEIPSTRAYSALSIHLTNLIVQSLNRQRHGFLKSKLTSIEPNRLPVQGADEVRTAKFTSDPKLNEDQLEKYQPGYITFMEIELELALGYTEHQPSYMFCLDDEYTFNPVGELRVLIADDQRTMRSMLAMLFQNTCSKFPKMSVLLSTALSAEEAVRLSKKNNFKMVIIDENFSSEYCSRMKSQQSKVLEILNVGNMATLTSSNRLMIDSNKSNSYNARTTFFADEALKHEILEGDGSITGHEATKLILTNHDLSLGAPPIVFTITGDVLRSDVDSYYRSGSSGVLPKPTMMLDFHEMIEKRTKVRWPCPSLKYIFQAYVENNLN